MKMTNMEIRKKIRKLENQEIQHQNNRRARKSKRRPKKVGCECETSHQRRNSRIVTDLKAMSIEIENDHWVPCRMKENYPVSSWNLKPPTTKQRINSQRHWTSQNPYQNLEDNRRMPPKVWEKKNHLQPKIQCLVILSDKDEGQL